MLRLVDDNAFGIVLSPIEERVKALCVHLTDEGFRKLEQWREIAGDDFETYVSSRINNGFDTFYCQIPFGISPISTKVIDLRSEEEVVGQPFFCYQ